MPGIGHVTECRLKAFGVEQIADLWKRRGTIFHLVPRAAFVYYMRILLGHSEDDWVDGATAAEDSDSHTTRQKSMSIERYENPLTRFGLYLRFSLL